MDQAFIKKKTLECRAIAQSHGGKFLSKSYIKSNALHTWQCKEGHVWEASHANISQGKWCKICYYSNQHNELKKQTFDEIKEIIREKGGTLLTNEYNSVDWQLSVQCSCGNFWAPRGSTIKRDAWCPLCSRKKAAKKKRSKVEDIQKICAQKGGKLISKEYLSGDDRLLVECGSGHQWEVLLMNLKSGKWCPYCRGKTSIEWFKQFASEKGGECLSENYKNEDTILRFQCNEGHFWKTKAVNIKTRRSWCPECRRVKLTLADCYNLARENNGSCLSDSFENVTKRANWMCRKGHKWNATYLDAKTFWCRMCNSLKNSMPT